MPSRHIPPQTYRYTAWVGFKKCQDPTCPEALADWETSYGEELYNHTCASPPCPDSFDVETENIATLPMSQKVKASLRAKLMAFNTKGIDRTIDPPPQKAAP